MTRRFLLNGNWTKTGTAAATVAALTAAAQYKYGHQQDFFDYRFYVTASADVDPDDLASFYGGEEFMELFCVVPFMGTLMMRGGHFDEEGTVHTTGFPGDLQVSMVFSDDSDDEDGNNTTKWFNKRERFKDVLFNRFTCWDMVTNFGFERQDDGRILVYHHGEYFHSNLPPLSLLVRFIFGIHAQWVAWATEHHINHFAFRSAKSKVDEELEEESRVDMPLFLLKNYAWSDLMAGLFGKKIEKPSFLVLKSEQAALEQNDQDDELPLPPVHRPAIQRRITVDIHLDRHNTKAAFLGDADDDQSKHTTTSPEQQQVPLEEGLQLTRQLTRRLTRKGDDEHEPQLETQRDNLSGNEVWEALRATNNPKAYKALTMAAKERRTQRRETVKSNVDGVCDKDNE